MTFITRLNKSYAVLPSPTSAPKILSFFPCNPLQCSWSSRIPQEAQPVGALTFFSWAIAQPNLGFEYCWTLPGMAWAWAAVTASPEPKYALAQLPATCGQTLARGKILLIKSRADPKLLISSVPKVFSDVLGWPWVWAMLENPESLGICSQVGLSCQQTWLQACLYVTCHPVSI